MKHTESLKQAAIMMPCREAFKSLVGSDQIIVCKVKDKRAFYYIKNRYSYLPGRRIKGEQAERILFKDGFKRVIPETKPISVQNILNWIDQYYYIRCKKGKGETKRWKDGYALVFESLLEVWDRIEATYPNHIDIIYNAIYQHCYLVKKP